MFWHFYLPFFVFLTFSSTQCKILFDGDASKPFKSVWKVNNCKDDGTKIDTVEDPTLGVTVWRFTKNVGGHRCEGHGAAGFQAKEGDDIYLGWNLNIDMDPADLTTNANFQWKDYPGYVGYPIVLKTISGQLVLQHYNHKKERTDLWSSGFDMDTWYAITLRIKVSTNPKKGFLEFWFQGEQVSFETGKNRFYGQTLDGDNGKLQTDPKWGIYGGDDGNVVNMVGNIKIATKFEEASPPVV